MTMTEEEIISIIKKEEADALLLCGENSDLNVKRALFLQYYEQEPYGDEEEGRSTIVTSEVFQVVEGSLPPMMRMFLQNKNIAEFKPTRKETKIEKIKRKAMVRQDLQRAFAEQDMKTIQKYQNMESLPDDIFEHEAQQKTALANYVFTQEHDPETILYTMIKDGLLAFTGWVQTYSEEKTDVEVDRITGISEVEVDILSNDKDSKVTEIKEVEDGTFDVLVTKTKKKRKIIVENIPPENCIISQREKDFTNPRLIGERRLVRRSDLIEMGFDKKQVEELRFDSTDDGVVKDVRHGGDVTESGSSADGLDPSMDKLWYRKYYMLIDVDEDGVAELWQFDYCDGQILKKMQVNNHPYSVFCPIPITHKAIGTTPIAHMYRYQHWMSTLVRQCNNNIYTVNFPRYFVTKDVNLDDFSNPVAGASYVRVKGSDANTAASLIPVDNQVQQIMAMIEYVQTQIERTTGLNSYNQGMDTESLNKTATGFVGMRDMSMMRTEVMARHAAVTVEDIYNKIVMLAANHQDEEMEIFVNGEELSIDPRKWSKEARCQVDVGIGAGERQEAIANLSYFLEQAKYCLETGIEVADQTTIYKILDKIAVHMGQKSADGYFNNPEKDGETLQAENEKLNKMVQELQQVLQERDPILAAEKIRAESKIQSEQMKGQLKMAETKANLEEKGRERMANMAAQSAELDYKRLSDRLNLEFQKEKLATDTAVKLTDIQTKTEKDVKGDQING